MDAGLVMCLGFQPLLPAEDLSHDSVPTEVDRPYHIDLVASFKAADLDTRHRFQLHALQSEAIQNPKDVSPNDVSPNDVS